MAMLNGNGGGHRAPFERGLLFRVFLLELIVLALEAQVLVLEVDAAAAPAARHGAWCCVVAPAVRVSVMPLDNRDTTRCAPVSHNSSSPPTAQHAVPSVRGRSCRPMCGASAPTRAGWQSGAWCHLCPRARFEREAKVIELYGIRPLKRRLTLRLSVCSALYAFMQSLAVDAHRHRCVNHT